MLRVSAQTTGTDIDLSAVNGSEPDAADGIRFGAELVRFAGSVASRDPESIRATREALLAAAGPRVLVDAAGVAANFQRMVRIADAIGIPVDHMDADLSRELDLERFASARNTPGVATPDTLR